MAVDNSDDAYALALWLNDDKNKTHPDRAAVQAALTDYIDNTLPTTSVEEARARASSQGRQMLADVPVGALGQQQETPPPKRQREPQIGPTMDQAHPKIMSLGQATKDIFTGAADIAVSGARGMVNQPSLTLKGMAAGGLAKVTGKDFTPAYNKAVEEGRATIEADQSLVKSERLRTPQGKAAMEAVGRIPGVQAVGAAVDWVGDRIEQIGGKPIRDLITSAISLGTLGRINKFAGPAEGALTPEAVAALGIDIKAPGNVIAKQIQDAVGNLRTPTRGEDMPAIRRALQEAHAAERSHVTQLFDQADQMGGRMKIPASKQLEAEVSDLIEKYNVMDLNNKAMKPILAQRLAEVNPLIEEGGNYRIKLGDLDRYRQRIEQGMRKTKDLDEKAGLRDLLSKVDGWETSAFTKIVAGGNKPAYEAFLKARVARADYANKFGPDRVLDQLLNVQDLSSKEIRDYLWGASSVVGNKHAAVLVNRMKKIFGEDSPEIVALRQDMLYDIVDPLVSGPTTAEAIKGFLHNYEKTVKMNPDLVNALDPFGKTHLDQAYKVAKALDNQGLTESALANRMDPLKIATRIIFGNVNPLASGAAKLRIVDSVVRAAANTVKPNRRRMYEELFGRNPKDPLVSNARKIVTAAAFAQDNGEDNK